MRENQRRGGGKGSDKIYRGEKIYKDKKGERIILTLYVVGITLITTMIKTRVMGERSERIGWKMVVIKERKDG